MSDAHCVGEPLLQYILYSIQSLVLTVVSEILGPDTVVLNCLVAFHERHGFVHNPPTKGVMDLTVSTYKQLGPLRLEEKLQTHTYRHPLLFKAILSWSLRFAGSFYLLSFITFFLCRPSRLVVDGHHRWNHVHDCHERGARMFLWRGGP
jgi:hypothetical protein